MSSGASPDPQAQGYRHDRQSSGAQGRRCPRGERSARCDVLPKYSPDLNPIEMPFSKLKAYLRKAADRTIPRLRRRIGGFARTLTTREASNYFRHAGYVGHRRGLYASHLLSGPWRSKRARSRHKINDLSVVPGKGARAEQWDMHEDVWGNWVRTSKVTQFPIYCGHARGWAEMQSD
jgi:hypothetical protein